MKLLFIRHGQGEHNLPVPDRLELIHPRLTARGQAQVERLRERIQVTSEDLLLISPTVRTIETALILTADLKDAALLTTPLVGPRMYPPPDSPAVPTRQPFGCDRILSREELGEAYPMLTVLTDEPSACWEDSINTMASEEFAARADRLLRSLRLLDFQRTLLISHDGTINGYRELLGETGLSRDDFLGEAGVWERELA